jgi:hypothetical protein
VPLIATLVLLLATAPAPPASAATNFVYAVAFESVSNQHLWYYDGAANTAHDTGLGMAFGSNATIMTSPAMVFDDAGFYVIAFQADTLHAAGNGRLWIYFPQGNGHTDSGLTMKAGTSPSISQTDRVAFQGSNGHLWYYDIGASGHDVNLGMAAGTNPSISADGTEIAFQANTGHLWTFNVGGAAHDTGIVLASGSSPSLGMCGAACYDVAYRASNGHLAEYRLANNSHVDFGLSMFDNPGMDPTSAEFVAYAGLPTGHVFWHDTINNSTTDTGLQIQNGSSPSMGPLSDPNTGLVTHWMIAFTPVISGGTLYTYDTTTKVSHDTGLGVEPFTSPAFTTGERLVFG